MIPLTSSQPGKEVAGTPIQFWLGGGKDLLGGGSCPPQLACLAPCLSTHPLFAGPFGIMGATQWLRRHAGNHPVAQEASREPPTNIRSYARRRDCRLAAVGHTHNLTSRAAVPH